MNSNIKYLIRTTALIEVETEIIKLRSRYIDNKKIDDVLTELQNKIYELKHYDEIINTDKIDINMSEEGIN